MTALEWIQQHGTHLRIIGAERLRRKLERQKGECTWCGEQVPKGRRRWCSAACFDEFLNRCLPQTITRRVGNRDKGVCAECGLDTEWLRRFLKKWRGAQNLTRLCRSTDWSKDECVNRRGRKNWRRVKRLAAISGQNRWLQSRGFNGQGLWEADHIVPVAEGGGLCDLSGYQTLCIPCHRKKSAAMVSAAAARKRPRVAMLPFPGLSP